MSQTRRTFLRNSGIGLLTFYVGGCEVEMTPRDAREREIPHRILTDVEVRTLDALGDILLPGSAAAGLSHFIDHQLGRAVRDQLLMIRYLGAPPPFLPFYRDGLAALNFVALARSEKHRRYADAEPGEQMRIAAQIAQRNPDGWKGPPAPFFYFVLRMDAIDVVYGTKAGIESLGIPYMAHIEPPSRWGE